MVHHHHMEKNVFWGKGKEWTVKFRKNDMYFWVFHLCCSLSGGALCYCSCWCSLCLNPSGSSTFWIWSNYPWVKIRPVVSLPCCGGEAWLLSVFMSGGRSLIRHLRFVKSNFVFFLIVLNAGANRERIGEYGKQSGCFWECVKVVLGCYRVRGQTTDSTLALQVRGACMALTRPPCKK